MFDEKTALITGATRGIGKAIALALARDAATVIGTATTDDGAASIAMYLKEANNAGTTLGRERNLRFMPAYRTKLLLRW